MRDSLRNWRSYRAAPMQVTREQWALCLLLVLLQSHSLLPAEKLAALYAQVGLENGAFFSGKVWTLGTYGFFHHPGGLSHLISNLTGLLLIGGRVQFLLGTRRYFELLGLGVLAGGVCHLVFSEFFAGESRILIGLSGGVFALFAALTTLSPESRFWPFLIRGKHLRNAFLFLSVVFLLCSPQLSLPWTEPVRRGVLQIGGENLFEMSHACHLGGLVAGMVIGNQLMRIPRMPRKFKKDC